MIYLKDDSFSPVFHNVEQGTQEWKLLRAGIPTASSFSKIITATGKKSEQRKNYMLQLVSEIIMGKPVEIERTYWMRQGNEKEAEAAEMYSIQSGENVQQVGFVTNYNMAIGCSPDRLVGENGLLEIKTLAPHNFVSFMLEENTDQYKPQIQGQMLVTGRNWCDLLVWSPDMPPIITRIERDNSYIDVLKHEIDSFLIEMNDIINRLTEKGYMQKEVL